jgi:uncharacterized tellurite resistance protein B-like protein
MLTYTDEEKNTIINLLTNVMEADSVIHPNEIEFMNSVMSSLNYTILNLDYGHEKDFFLNKNLFHKMDAEKQLEVKNLLIGMAECDGFIDKREQELIDNI